MALVFGIAAPIGCNTDPIAGVIDAAAFDDIDAGSSTVRKRAFVTRTTSTGRLGGIAGADAICAESADAAGLGGIWKAWISDSATDAISRLGARGPWYFVDRTTKIFEPIDRTSDMPLRALVNFDHDEYGEPITTFVEVWTGTLRSGLRARDTCDDWTSAADAAGTVGNVDDRNYWTGDPTEMICQYTWRLFCFED